MKKVLLILAMAFVSAIAVNAQDFYVGGSLGLWSNGDATGSQTKSTFSIMPEVGYNLSDAWSLGFVLGYRSSKPDTGDSTTSISFAPYARYHFLQAGNLRLFCDGELKIASTDYGSAKSKSHEIGLKPGISYALSESCSIVAHMGFFGYRGGDNKGQNGFGLNLSNNLSFGFFYSF